MCFCIKKIKQAFLCRLHHFLSFNYFLEFSCFRILSFFTTENSFYFVLFTLTPVNDSRLSIRCGIFLYYILPFPRCHFFFFKFIFVVVIFISQTHFLKHQAIKIWRLQIQDNNIFENSFQTY